MKIRKGSAALARPWRWRIVDQTLTHRIRACTALLWRPITRAKGKMKGQRIWGRSHGVEEEEMRVCHTRGRRRDQIGDVSNHRDNLRMISIRRRKNRFLPSVRVLFLYSIRFPSRAPVTTFVETRTDPLTWAMGSVWWHISPLLKTTGIWYGPGVTLPPAWKVACPQATSSTAMHKSSQVVYS
jgi:hypothetical protein